MKTLKKYWEDLCRTDEVRLPIVSDWLWWRHGHGCTFWQAVNLTIQTGILSPINNIYCGIKLRTTGRKRMRKILKMQAEIEEMQKERKLKKGEENGS